MHTNINDLCHFSSYRYNSEELFMVIEENVHFAKYIVFEMLLHKVLTLNINMNIEFWEQRLRGEKARLI